MAIEGLFCGYFHIISSYVVSFEMHKYKIHIVVENVQLSGKNLSDGPRSHTIQFQNVSFYSNQMTI